MSSQKLTNNNFKFNNLIAQNVFLGDGNKLENLSVKELLSQIESKVKNECPKSKAKSSFLNLIKHVTSNPTFSSIANTTISHFFNNSTLS